MIAVLPGVLTGVLAVAMATAVSFIVIALVTSYYRFQHIVRKAEEVDLEEMDAVASDALRVQLARFLTTCARRGTSFSLALIRTADDSLSIQADSPFIQMLKSAVRSEDVVCAYDAQTAAVVGEIDSEDAEPTLIRILKQVAQACPDVAEEQLRVGLASYPGHGLAGNMLIQVAQDGLAKCSEEHRIIMPEITVPDDEEEEEENASAGDVGEVADAEHDKESHTGSWAERRKTAMLDELTGVLKPSAVSSYMQRMMNDLRHQRKPASLFCIGVNNIDYIRRIHGDQAVDDILVGISRILQDSVRASDLIGRHEKYAFLILARIPLEEAEIVGRRIGTLVQQAEFASGGKKLKTTVTLGFASHPEHGRNLHLLYKAGQKVLDYNRENDIRSYAVYDPDIHDRMPAKPMKNIKSLKA